MMFSFPEKTDSYKVSHYRQYPPGTTCVYSYFESRGGVYPDTTFFGLQGMLKDHFVGQVLTQPDIDEAADLYGEHFGDPNLFNRAGFEHIVNDHGGHLPLSIRAVPEGTTVPVSNVLMTVENTCPKCYWLTNFAETLLVQNWYPTTVATQSRHLKKLIHKWLVRNGTPEEIGFKLHDFGFRGVSSVESAAIGGAAHLVNFLGTDTVVALRYLRRRYGIRCAGFSVPAAEHSTITSWGREFEAQACDNMLVQYPKGIVAVVSDSYDVFNACDNIWGGSLVKRVMARPGVLVVRPDSGTPEEVVSRCVHSFYNNPQVGGTVNQKGSKVISPKVRIIQGDGVDGGAIDGIYSRLHSEGFSSDNVGYGMGGALLQKLDRDTQKFAFKCSQVAGHFGSRDVYKDPITDSGKRSKRGRLALRKGMLHEGFWTDSQQNNLLRDRGSDQLVEVFRDGQLLVDDSFDKIRERAAI
jgi:nicotinamide phosphoribosyltransferase